MVWYFNMQGREVVSINPRLEDLAIIDAFCKRRNVSRSPLMVQAALAFCAAKKGKPIQFRGPSRASTAWQLKRHAAAKARRKRCEAGHQELLQLRDLVKSLALRRARPDFLMWRERPTIEHVAHKGWIARAVSAWNPGFPGCGINRREEKREHRRRQAPMEV
jgi:hypothetical protein